jgi:hypothetical protein
MLCLIEKWLEWLFYNQNKMYMYLINMLLVKTANKALQVTFACALLSLPLQSVAGKRT